MTPLEHLKTHNKAYSLGFLAVVAALVGFLFIQVDNLSITQEMTGALIKPIPSKTQGRTGLPSPSAQTLITAPLAGAPQANPAATETAPATATPTGTTPDSAPYVPTCPDARTRCMHPPCPFSDLPCPSGQVLIGPDAASNSFSCQRPSKECGPKDPFNCQNNTCK